MHPIDVGMSPGGPITYTVGADPVGNFPMACWQTNNNPVTINFNLAANQIVNLTLRVGITVAYAGGRPKPSIGSWTPANPAAPSEPNSRTLTLGTYRANNALYTFSVPSTALVLG